MTTSANFTSIVKTCMTIIGVTIKEINGNTFEFVKRSLMWFARRINIAIVTKTAIEKINVSSDSYF